MIKFNSKNFEIHENSSIFQVLNIFRKNRVNICVVVNRHRQFLGIITPSDIKKSFLQGSTSSQKITEIFNKKPLFVKGVISERKISKILSSKRFDSIKPPIIPVVDSKDRLINFVEKNNLFNLNNNFYENNNQTLNKILIFGGAGYIGSVLVEHLLSLNYEVTVYDKFIYNSKMDFIKKFKNEKLKVINGDSQNISKIFDSIRKNDIVIHLAEMVGDPLCEKRPVKTYSINYLASITISNICKNLGITKFIYVSSCSVYGSNDNFTDENSKINPLSIYAKLKVLCEKAIIRNTDENCKPFILRLGTVYGVSSRPRYDLVANLFAGLVANNKTIKISGGDQWRPFVHVKDVSRAIVKIINLKNLKNKNRIYNIVGQNIKISELGKIIKKIYPKTKIIVEDKIVDRRNYKSSNLKAKRNLKFRTLYSLKEGIKEVVKYTKDNNIKNIFRQKYINILNHSKF